MIQTSLINAEMAMAQFKHSCMVQQSAGIEARATCNFLCGTPLEHTILREIQAEGEREQDEAEDDEANNVARDNPLALHNEDAA